MNHRLQRIEHLIKKELSAIISKEVSLGSSLVTIHHVSISPDLKNCHLYCGVLQCSADTGQKVFSKLQSMRSSLQQTLAKRVLLKYTPRLHFHLDESIEKGLQVLKIMDEIHIPEDEEGAIP